MKISQVWTLLTLAVSVTRCHGRPGPEETGHSGHHLIPLTQDLSIRLFPFPHLTRTRDPAHVSHVSAVDTSRIQGENKRRVAFFTDNPLITVKRSFQDIQTNVERSMQSLLAAGSAIGHRMLGMITRSPRLLLPPAGAPATAAAAAGHHSSHGENFPDFTNCDCHFGSDSVSPAQFQPYNDIAPPVADVSSNDIESYGAPAADVVSYPAPAPPADIESYGAPAAPVLENYGSPTAPVAPSYSPPSPAAPSYIPPAPAPSYEAPPSTTLPSYSDGPIVDLTSDISENTIDGEPIIAQEPVIHPGGSQSVDYNKVSHIGVHTVVQAASAQVPDQSHPEKYLNHNHDHLVDVVGHNLWRKETTKFKHHHHGEKLRVIPHLQPVV